MNIDRLSVIELADKVLMGFKDYDRIHVDDAFINAGMTQEEIDEVRNTVIINKAITALEVHLEYVKRIGSSSNYILTEKGRQVKAAGGHFVYIKKQEEKSKVDAERQKRKDNSEELDLKIKRWTYKARYAPFIFSGLALIGTITSVTISIKALNSKTSHQDLESLKQTIQQLQERTNRLDSLFQVDTHRNSRK